MHAPELIVVDDVTDAWVPRFVALCHHAVAARGRFTVALAGGSTPLAGYRRLRERRDLPWERVWVTWGDERDVPDDHPDRNARAAREALLDHVAIPKGHVLDWPRADTPEAAAEAHARTLRTVLGDPLDLDLALLGLGADAHTASLFPGTGASDAVGITTVVRPAADRPARLSLTAPALGRAREAWVLVSGADKRDALERTLRGDGTPDELPVTAIHPREALRVFADHAAAGAGEDAGRGGRAEPRRQPGSGSDDVDDR